MNSSYLTCLCTVPNESVGKTIAHELIGKQLAPCVNMIPGVKSLYTWKGELHEDSELVLVIKTRGALFEKVCQAITSVHPYEVPEIIALPIIAGHAPYLAWIDENTLVDERDD